MTLTAYLLAIVLLVLLGVLGALVLLYRRLQGRNADERLEALGQQVAAHKTALEMIDQRLGQVHQQVTGDGTQLREQIGNRLDGFRQTTSDQLADDRARTVNSLAELREQIGQTMAEHRTRVEEQSARAQKAMQDSMREGYESLHKQLGESLLRNSTDLGQRVEALTKVTDERLRDIGGQVEKRLSDGFKKTTDTFTDVVKRLALIDEAQKKITALSSEVVGLQQLLDDKRSRGAFGEVQLATLVGNIMPQASFALQHRLSNDTIVDCILFLPDPTGNVCIDSKFPLESYRIMTDVERPESERRRAQSQFKQDIKKHIRDISEKYILAGETAEGAVMFVPAEAVFAEIQAHHADLVETAQAARVWIASPTTLWAILNTASAVLKDASTRQQVHVIQEHLGALGVEFGRFRERMEKLSRHIRQANDDVKSVNTTAEKISGRFEKIERVELEKPETLPTGLEEPDD